MNALSHITSFRRSNPLGFSDTALASIAGEDMAFEANAHARGYLQPGESYGFKVIKRSLTTGAPTTENYAFRTRIEALEWAHANKTPGFVFKRIEVVRTVFEEQAA